MRRLIDDSYFSFRYCLARKRRGKLLKVDNAYPAGVPLRTSTEVSSPERTNHHIYLSFCNPCIFVNKIFIMKKSQIWLPQLAQIVTFDDQIWSLLLIAVAPLISADLAADIFLAEADAFQYKIVQEFSSSYHNYKCQIKNQKASHVSGQVRATRVVKYSHPQKNSTLTSHFI